MSPHGDKIFNTALPVFKYGLIIWDSQRERERERESEKIDKTDELIEWKQRKSL